MINTILLGMLAVSFLFYLYSFLRPKFKSRVNCWFCNVNQWVPYQQKNSFTCKKCDQYNGFDKDGDYNKFIASQRIETLNTHNPSAKKLQFTTFPNTNGLCELCNQLQAVIIERLNKFEAVDENRYFEEYETYKSKLNRQYPLCDRCQEFTTQKLAHVNERYLPKSTTIKKSASLFPQQNTARRNTAFSSAESRAPSTITSSSRAPSIFSQQSVPSVVSEPNTFGRSVFSQAPEKALSVFSMPAGSSFSETRTRVAASLFSEPIGTPSFIRTSKAPSVASGFSFGTRYQPIFNEEYEDEAMDYSMQKSRHESFRKPKHNHENRQRKLYFASGKITIACNILSWCIAIILFMSLFDSSQISTDIRLLAFEKYLPIDTVNALHLCTHYATYIGFLATVIFYFGFSKSATRVNFVDLLACISWPIFTTFCIFDAERNPDFNCVKMIFAAYLCILSSMILFIPKKRKHRKRPNTIYSAFSVASTPASQCSSRLTASRIHNMSNLSNISQASKNDSVPDLVDEWVQNTVTAPSHSVEQHTVTKLHDLHL